MNQDKPVTPTVKTNTRDERQQQVTAWARTAFGEAEAISLPQRGIRLLEGAIEAFQACGGHERDANKLVAYVFARPPGAVGQELGGVAVCVLLLAAAAELSADEEECREIDRVLAKPIAHFTERNANKNAAGFLMADARERCDFCEAVCRQVEDPESRNPCPQHGAPWLTKNS